MRFIWQSGPGARRRVMHLTGFDVRTGRPTMQALCGAIRDFNRSCNLPLGQRICTRCRREAA